MLEGKWAWNCLLGLRSCCWQVGIYGSEILDELLDLPYLSHSNADLLTVLFDMSRLTI